MLAMMGSDASQNSSFFIKEILQMNSNTLLEHPSLYPWTVAWTYLGPVYFRNIQVWSDKVLFDSFDGHTFNSTTPYAFQVNAEGGGNEYQRSISYLAVSFGIITKKGTKYTTQVAYKSIGSPYGKLTPVELTGGAGIIEGLDSEPVSMFLRSTIKTSYQTYNKDHSVKAL